MGPNRPPNPAKPQLKALLDHPLVKIRSLCITRPIELEDLQAFAPTLLKAKIEVFDIKNCSERPRVSASRLAPPLLRSKPAGGALRAAREEEERGARCG